LWEGRNPQIEVEEVAKVILFVCGVRSIEGLHRGGGSSHYREVSPWRTWLHSISSMQTLTTEWQLARFLNLLLAGEGELDNSPALGDK